MLRHSYGIIDEPLNFGSMLIMINKSIQGKGLLRFHPYHRLVTFQIGFAYCAFPKVILSALVHRSYGNGSHNNFIPNMLYY